MLSESVPEFSENVSVLTDGPKTYYIVGTAHVSEQSVNEVRTVIETVQPDTVCVELCKTRYDALMDENRWKNLDIFKVILDGKALLLLANVAMSSYQRRLGAKLGIDPGAELLEGARQAEEVGANLKLVDRDIQTTLKRTWANVGFWKKVQLLSAVIGSTVSKDELDAETVERLKGQAQLSEMLAEFAEFMPGVKTPLIDERDQYLMSSIEEAEGEKVVAVVGAAHVPGMLRAFGTQVDRTVLDEIPPRKAWVSALKWVIPTLVLAAFYFGWSKHQGEGLEQMLYAWIIPNSVFAGLLTLVAGGKLISIITAFVCSPITSLNPMLGAGMVVGLVEAWLRKPTVKDAENINEDIQSLRGFYRNAFTRVLLVAFMSTIGSALGAYVGAGLIVTLLT